MVRELNERLEEVQKHMLLLRNESSVKNDNEQKVVNLNRENTRLLRELEEA